MSNYKDEQIKRFRKFGESLRFFGANAYVGGGSKVFLKSKPPLGVKPKWLHDEERKQELKKTIERHLVESEAIPIEWVEEYNELTSSRGVEHG